MVLARTDTRTVARTITEVHARAEHGAGTCLSTLARTHTRTRACVAAECLPAAQPTQLPIFSESTSISAKFRHVSERGWTTNTYLPIAPHPTKIPSSPERIVAHAWLSDHASKFPTLICKPSILSAKSVLAMILTETILCSDSRSIKNHSSALSQVECTKVSSSPSTANSAGYVPS
jgi:hypothetical protein